ncbi:MAG: DNA recombination protein RmuC [Bacilli bacterium]|nr:DNA recombination protein RmuC [Bacilli bacterium]MDD3895982.1 DNA recombination protein RmuC [Bacilli bacterium]MDD4407672.1 DNA recombination protein RmuC [Bacilli bacterium]
MEYIVIALLVIIIILLIILLVRRSNNEEITLRLGKFETDLTKELGEFKFDFSKSLQNDFKGLNETIERRLNYINEKVNERLDANFEKTNKTFTSILERITKIDEAQKKIDSLSGDIIALQSVLTDKKTRGIFGETNLNYILDSIFGKNDKIYQTQYLLSNKTVVDAILFAPQPLGTIAIDSKFPLENYQIMTNTKLDKSIREEAKKLFKSDVKKHIDAIKNKYIIDGETAGEAIMFLPAEAIFAEINAYHSDLIEYSYKSKVWITSPTTLMSTLTIIGMILKNMERDKYAKIIHEELNKLSTEFDRYKSRWDKLSKSINAVSKEAEEINITTDKITKRFASINNVNLELPEE